MAEITAKLVNDLRAKTGQGMMECKKMLTEAGGDLDKAVDLFRKKGVKASLAERAASEGRVFGARSADGQLASLVEINCNTDFTARSEPVQQVGNKGANLLLQNPKGSLADGLTADLTSVAQKTGENVRLGKTAVLSNSGGKVGLYIYSISGKIGVLLSFSGNVANASDELITDIGGHIAFSKPLALNRESLPAALVAKEKEIAVEQAKALGKPQQIAEKIAEGKMAAFYAERTLLDQEFFNSQKFKGTISQYLKNKGVNLEQYVRIEVGQQ
ncbi:MAG TPA: translation elongation factor Ts [Tepidisphaeraceae bacterium]|jgi:elongation factor Ts|nr:translation elongation factor Ts [Tepidisphaeraceae bacterium]